jgi:FKBP-type peptidyl-prolyl cis-trans isomerase
MYKIAILGAALAGVITFTSCEGSKNAGKAELKDTKDSVSYAIGMDIGRNLKEEKLEEINAELIAAAISAVLKDDSANFALSANPDSLYNIISAYMDKKREAESLKAKEEGIKFLAENAKKAGVTVTPSGLQYKVITSGSGATPVDGDSVAVYFKGTFIDGKEFQSTQPGQPATFVIDEVIKGWREVLKLMKVGDKWLVYVPAELAYGETGNQGGIIPPHATLIFEMELLRVAKP